MAEKKSGGGGWSSWFFGSGATTTTTTAGAATSTPAPAPAASSGARGGNNRNAQAAGAGAKPSSSSSPSGGKPAAPTKPAPPTRGGGGEGEEARGTRKPAGGGDMFVGLEVAQTDVVPKQQPPKTTTKREEEEESSPPAFAFINGSDNENSPGLGSSGESSVTSSPSGGAPVRKRRAAKRPGTYYQEGDQPSIPAASPNKTAAGAPTAVQRDESKASQPRSIPAKPNATIGTASTERNVGPPVETQAHGDGSAKISNEQTVDKKAKDVDEEESEQARLREKRQHEEEQRPLEKERKKHKEQEIEAAAAEEGRQKEIRMAEEELRRKQAEEQEKTKALKYERVIGNAKKELAVLESERQLLSDQQRGILSEQREKNREMIASQEQLFRYENEQAQALNQEDFERAERLNERIEEVKQAMKDIARQKLDFGQELLALHTKKGQVAHKEAYLRRNYIAKLRELKAEEEVRLDAFKSQVSSKFSEEKERVSAKKKGIQKHLNHVRMDLEMLLKSEEAVEQSISSQTQSYKEELHQLNQKRETVQREIEDLMKLLAQKKKEEEEYTKQITGLEKNITRVTDRFKTEMERIAIEREAIAKDNDKYSQQMAELKKAKRKLKDEEAKDRESEKTYFAALSTIEAELNHCQDSMDRLERREGELRKMKDNYEAFYRMESEQEKQLSATREQTSSCSTTITELTTRVLSIQQEIHAANQRIVALDARIPSLESEKKLAVSGRNFKEAKRIAEEMKTATVQIDESKQVVTTLTSQLENCKLQLSQHKEKYKVLEQELQSAESKADKIKLSALRGKERELLSKLTKYGNDGEETDILVLELESCKTEIAYIRLKWNIPEQENINSVEPPFADAEEDKDTHDQVISDEVQREETLDVAATQEALRLVLATIEQYEVELEECVAKDDWDRADEINQLIEQAKSQSEALKARLAAVPAHELQATLSDSAEATEKGAPVEASDSPSSESAFSFVIASASDDEAEAGDEDQQANENEDAPSSSFSFLQEGAIDDTDTTPAQEKEASSLQEDNDETTRPDDDATQDEPSGFAFISEPREEEEEGDSQPPAIEGSTAEAPVESTPSEVPATADEEGDESESSTTATESAEPSSFAFIANDDSVEAEDEDAPEHQEADELPPAPSPSGEVTDIDHRRDDADDHSSRAEQSDAADDSGSNGGEDQSEDGSSASAFSFIA